MRTTRSGMIDPSRALCAAAALALFAIGSAQSAAAQITTNGDSNLSAINSGDISLHGTVTNPTVSGGTDNSAGNLAAQGASSSYSINDTNLNANGDAVGTSTASASGNRLQGSNSGTVNVRGTITGGSFAGNNNSQSISATGLSNIISIKTSSSK